MHRPMRRSDREVCDKEGLLSIIESCRVLRIAAVDDEGPFIVPVNFGYEWEGAASASPDGCGVGLVFWFHSALEGRKADAFERNPQVAFELDVEDAPIAGSRACGYSCAFRSIMGTGRVRRVDDREEKAYGLTCLMSHVAPHAPIDFSERMVERTAVYRIEADHLTGKRRPLP